MRFIFKAIFVVMATLATQYSFAWGTTGHRVVAEIAQRHLSKKAIKGVKELIGDERLAYWANWPDFIKSDTTHTWDKASKWHYVDLPGNIDKETFNQDLEQLHGENLFTQITAMVTQLKDKSLPLEKRKNALSFLIHLIGDLHQPLHVGRDEDQGGNKITVYWFEKKTNLHSLWDSGLIDSEQYSYTEFATVLDVANKEQVNTWQQSSLKDWFYESHVLADKVYSLTPPDSKLSYKYVYVFQHDLEMQLLKAGVRLAQVLNEAFN